MVEKPVSDPQFEALRYIQESRGLDFRGYKRTSLRRRISIRMQAAQVEYSSACQSHLEVHPTCYESGVRIAETRCRPARGGGYGRELIEKALP
jgi:hypothetical protein